MRHMTDTEFERTCSFISRSLGLEMKSKRVLLECRLTRECDRLALPSFSDYLDLIERGTNPEATRRFIDLVTTHYTYFMRESSQFSFLENVAFPELEQRASGRPWRILCAGCSTGEEAYTLSMLVEDYSRLRQAPQVTIRALDVSEPVLETARQAIYGTTHIDKVPHHWKALYFVPEHEQFRVTDRIRNRVTFQKANLGEAGALRGAYDLILCRNVIIYFTHEAKQKAIDQLARHLEPGGFLVLGHAEIVRDRTAFTYEGNSIYRKQKAGTR